MFFSFFRLRYAKNKLGHTVFFPVAIIEDYNTIIIEIEVTHSLNIP